MKKTMRSGWILLLLTLMMAGCGAGGARQGYRAPNEILTYDRVDPKRTQLSVSRTGNITIKNLCEEFEKQNPDVQVIYLDITGGNDRVTPAIDWIKNGYAPDVMISASDFFDGEESAEYFEDLSANPVLANYEADALKRTAFEGRVYWLPGPSNISAILYNKTLFDQYGWPLPDTFDAFIALCERIEKDTNGAVDPWNPNAKYSNELLTAMEGFTYGEVFGGAENRAWYNDFMEGNETFQGHMEPYYAAIQRLIDAGLLTEEDFSYSATTRGEEFRTGKIAMINAVVDHIDQESYDFGYLPFPSTDGELGYLSDSYSSFVGVPKKERSKKVQDAVDRFLAFFSSPEGQEAFIENGLKASNVKNVPLKGEADLIALQPAIDAGHLFGLLEFRSPLIHSNLALYDDAYAMTVGEKTAADCIEAADQPRPPALDAAPETEPSPLANVPRDLTVLETSFYLADAYRETMNAEIGLIAHNTAFRGNLMRILKGDLGEDFLTVLKPRSFKNGSKLIRAVMTGEQLISALNAPMDFEGKTADCIYAYSGLTCRVAPWNPLGEKYLSVKLPDGSEIDPERYYTVALWEGTVEERFLSGIEESYEGSFEDAIAAKIKRDGTIAAFDDGRILIEYN